MKSLMLFRKIVQRLTYLLCSIGMFLAIPLMLITTTDVIGRGFFNKPLAGTLELSEYMLSIIILLGAAYTQQVKGHVGVNFLTKHFSARTQEILNIITTLAGMFIVSILVWQGYTEGIHEKTVSDQLRVPQWPFRLLVPIGGILLLLELLADVFASVLKIKGRQT